MESIFYIIHKKCIHIARISFNFFSANKENIIENEIVPIFSSKCHPEYCL